MQQTKVIKTTVTHDKLACEVGSGTLRVFATPAMCALFEQAASQLAEELVEPGQTTVGASLQIEHLAPTPEGAEVTVTATRLSQEGRKFEFSLLAEDPAGVIGKGTHTRVAVYSERFQQKADARAKS